MLIDYTLRVYLIKRQQHEETTKSAYVCVQKMMQHMHSLHLKASLLHDGAPVTASCPCDERQATLTDACITFDGMLVASALIQALFLPVSDPYGVPQVKTIYI